MRFYTRKRRSPAVIIVSLIDILAILLIFFIVTTTFKKQQPQLEINLPESKSAAPVADATDEPVLLRVKSESEIFLGDEPISLAGLTDALLAMQASNPGQAIAMQADREAPFGVVVRVLDSLKEAGIRNIPAFTEPLAEELPQP